jgi:hypothetical protein
MKWMTWKALVPPAALPLAVSVAVALAGPGGFFASTPPNTPAALVSDIRPTDGPGTPTPIVTHPGPTPAPTQAGATPPVPTPPVKPSPLPSPAPTPPPTPGPTLPPGSTSTPSPAPTPTPPPGPIFIEAEVVVMVKNYTITNMATVTVAFNWCTADWLGSAWGAICQIVDPACKAFTDLGLPCPLPPLALNFYLYEAVPTIVPADAATTLILQTY